MAIHAHAHAHHPMPKAYAFGIFIAFTAAFTIESTLVDKRYDTAVT